MVNFKFCPNNTHSIAFYYCYYLKPCIIGGLSHGFKLISSETGF